MAYDIDWSTPFIAELTDAELADAGLAETVREVPDESELLRPGGVCVAAGGAVVVTEPDADRIRWTGPDGQSVVLGGLPGFVDGPAGVARFRHPLGLASSPDGSVVVADTGNHAIRHIAPDRAVTTLAGGLYGATDGPGAQARFRYPQGVAVAPDGTVLVADTGNDTVRKIDASGMTTVFAGGRFGHNDPALGPLALRRPEAVALDAGGTVYIADTGNDRVWSIDPGGRHRLLAGRGRPGNAAAPAPALRWPDGLATAGDGTVYVCDAVEDALWRIRANGDVDVLNSDPGWQPVALCASGKSAVIVAESHWSPASTAGRLRVIADHPSR